MPMVCHVNMTPKTTEGAPTLSGTTQVVASPAGVWRITFEGVPLNTPERIKAWRAIEAQAEGRANPLIVPTYDRPALTPDAIENWLTTHSDGTPFSDGSRYYSSGQEIRVGANAVVGAVQLTVNKVQGGLIDAGQHFSIKGRLYRVKYLISQATVRIWPPLREAIAEGDLMEFDRPSCKVKLASDGAMNAPLTISRFGVGNVSFNEDVS